LKKSWVTGRGDRARVGAVFWGKWSGGTRRAPAIGPSQVSTLACNNPLWSGLWGSTWGGSTGGARRRGKRARTRPSSARSKKKKKKKKNRRGRRAARCRPQPPTTTSPLPEQRQSSDTLHVPGGACERAVRGHQPPLILSLPSPTRRCKVRAPSSSSTRSHAPEPRIHTHTHTHSPHTLSGRPSPPGGGPGRRPARWRRRQPRRNGWECGGGRGERPRPGPGRGPGGPGGLAAWWPRVGAWSGAW
jgi:hypothetical protein